MRAAPTRISSRASPDERRAARGGHSRAAAWSGPTSKNTRKPAGLRSKANVGRSGSSLVSVARSSRRRTCSSLRATSSEASSRCSRARRSSRRSPRRRATNPSDKPPPRAAAGRPRDALKSADPSRPASVGCCRFPSKYAGVGERAAKSRRSAARSRSSTQPSAATAKRGSAAACAKSFDIRGWAVRGSTAWNSGQLTCAKHSAKRPWGRSPPRSAAKERKTAVHCSRSANSRGSHEATSRMAAIWGQNENCSPQSIS